VDLRAGSFLSPLYQDPSIRLRHWLGTDAIGRDVLAGMIRGCRISLLVGFGSMLLALLIGIPLGSLAAYFGNRGWKLSWLQLITILFFSIAFLYVVCLPVEFRAKIFVALLLCLLSALLIILFGKFQRTSSRMPVDSIVMSVVRIIDSFPGLFIILIILVLIPVQGWLIVTLIIALLRWPVMARYMRAEVYKLKETNFIKAVQILNLPDHRILLHHIIPYAFRPVLISFIFGVSSAILAESSLSFLGIGIPVEELNWGKLLSQSRNHFDAWWLVLFPGAAIFFTLLSLYTIGNAIDKSFHGRFDDRRGGFFNRV
jgi:peptide/nickel transport system permease protein